MRVVILMGSRADKEHADKIVSVLGKFEVPVEVRIASAHKAPRVLLDIIEEYDRQEGPLVYIGIAGRSNALSGVLDWATLNPVITCPPSSSAYGGADIFSSLRMPSGIATPTILEPEGAALLAVKLLGLAQPALRERLQRYRNDMLEKMRADDAALASDR